MMIKLQLATALKWWIDSKMDEISIRMNGAKAGRVGGNRLIITRDMSKP